MTTQSSKAINFYFAFQDYEKHTVGLNNTFCDYYRVLQVIFSMNYSCSDKQL